MTDKKLTDEEIEKALECCRGIETSCEICPYDGVYYCQEIMFQDTLDIINRQKEEIEDLKGKSNLISDCKVWTVRGNATVLTETLEDYEQFKRSIEIEAIKEFAERLEKIYSKQYTTALWKPLCDDIENLVKEMESENE